MAFANPTYAHNTPLKAGFVSTIVSCTPASVPARISLDDRVYNVKRLAVLVDDRIDPIEIVLIEKANLNRSLAPVSALNDSHLRAEDPA
jgi:hypothetical protein